MTPSRRAFLQQLGLASAGFSILPAFTGCAKSPPRPKPMPVSGRQMGLPRSTPEAQGVSSASILAFLNALAQSTHEFHSLMIVRHGRLIAEGWWAPYGPTYNHSMYSMSKSFTSTAVGLAVAEKRLTVDDPVLKFFPDQAPANPGEHLQALKVKDLLSMSVGHASDSTGPITKEQDWVRAFLALPIPNVPGTKFLYNSGATYMCSAIVQQLTGQRVIDYLKPRLFDPLGVSGMTWETCPKGINTGGWGLGIRTEGLARFGQLYLQNGKWNGRQILPAAWVEEATSFKIQQPLPAKPARPNEQNDWLQGYAYQFWRSQHGAFRGDGAFGQFTIVLPEQDAVIAITSESSSMQGELDLVWQYLLPGMKNVVLPDDYPLQERLHATLNNLGLAPVPGRDESPVGNRISGRTFRMDANPLGIQSVTLEFNSRLCDFIVKDADGAHAVRAEIGAWRRGEANLPGTPPRLLAGGSPPKGTPAKYAASGAWKDASTLVLMLRYYETPHHDSVEIKLEGDRVQIAFTSSIAKLRSAKDARPVLTGKLA